MNTDDPVIKEVTDADGVPRSVEVIRASFRTVADEFGLNEKNASTRPSNITFERLQAAKDKGQKLFGLFLGSEQVGFIAIDASEAPVYHFERLSVLPSYRRRKYGEVLVDFACDYIRKNGGQKVAIGIIDEHTTLKEWYKRLGFKVTGTRKFNHLPFTVGLMEKELASVEN